MAFHYLKKYVFEIDEKRHSSLMFLLLPYSSKASKDVDAEKTVERKRILV